jgi:hypothetical protein
MDHNNRSHNEKIQGTYQHIIKNNTKMMLLLLALLFLLQVTLISSWSLPNASYGYRHGLLGRPISTCSSRRLTRRCRIAMAAGDSNSSSSSNSIILGIESTPNPSSFLIKLSRPLNGLKSLAGSLRGNTYSATAASAAPDEICSILQIDGIDSVYAMATILTINKKASAKWEAVLPLVLKSLLEEDDGDSTQQLQELLLPGLLLASLSLSNINQNDQTTTTGQVRMRIQLSNNIPIQIEGTGSLGTVQRLKLTSKFQEYMEELQQDDTIDFFAGRKWMDRGIRYYLPDEDEDDDSHDTVGNGSSSIDSFTYSSSTEEEKELLELQFVLQTEAKEVDDAYPPERLARIVSESRLGGKGKDVHPPSSPQSHFDLTLEDVDRFCNLADGDDGNGDINNDSTHLEALNVLVDFVSSSNQGLLAARRNALAYLGGIAAAAAGIDYTQTDSTATVMNDRVFHAVALAFQNEKNPMMRRTAGDAFSDLGDHRAVPYAVTALEGDRSKLVQWRAARILGELADSTEIAGFLKQQTLDGNGKYAFEVAFEIKDALRKVQARLRQNDTNDDGSGNVAPAPKGPIWKQIQERGASP